MENSSLHSLIETIVLTSNNNITITNGAGEILYFNPKHWTVYGVKQEDCLGKTVYELEAKGVFNPSITALVIKKKQQVELMQQTLTGKTIMTTAYPIFDSNNQIQFVVSYAQDQTEINKLHLQYKELERQIQNYQQVVKALRQQETAQYRNKKMEEIKRTIHRVANTNATILLLGESGVGKSMWARKIHQLSNERNEPLIEVNCSTIPESLFETELFGYEPGSFTGAHKQGKKGLIEQAHHGTLFLDEIGELSLSLQVKLLKVLVEKKFKRVGSNTDRTSHFRLITATNRPLEEMVNKGEFRLDLYYRINVIPIEIPPLKKRKEDIVFLASHYLSIMNNKYHMEKELHTETYEYLTEYHWPGNVRELENLIERLVLTVDSIIIYPSHLPQALFKNKQMEPDIIDLPLPKNNESLKARLERIEKHILLHTYKQYPSSYKVADLLGISQASAARKLKKYRAEIRIKPI